MIKTVPRAGPHNQFGHYKEQQNYYILEVTPCNLVVLYGPVEVPALICMDFYYSLKMVAISSFKIASTLHGITSQKTSVFILIVLFALNFLSVDPFTLVKLENHVRDFDNTLQQKLSEKMFKH
jgi:hypothetical protein